MIKSDNQYLSLLNLARNVIYDAGEILRKRFYDVLDSGIDSKLKSKEQIVTSVDLEVNTHIEKVLKTYTPSIPILSEENEHKIDTSGYYWIVDPLDGTTNFVSQSSFFNITLALAHGKSVVLGVVYAPMVNQMYYAVKKHGAFLNSKRIKMPLDNNERATVHGFCYGSKDSKSFELAANYYKTMLLKGYSVRQFGAAALELSRVATGILASMYVPGANAWDVAAGALIVREAGGKVLDETFSDWNLNSKEIIAGSYYIINNVLKDLI